MKKMISLAMTASMLAGVIPAGIVPVMAEEACENYALGKQAYCSTINSAYPNYLAEMAVDGDYRTQWYSDYSPSASNQDLMEAGTAEWLYVDLEESREIGRAVISWTNSFGQGYKLQVSDDAETWTDVYSGSVSTGTSFINFTPVTSRFVRVYCTSMAVRQKGFGIWELEVYAPEQEVKPVGVSASSVRKTHSTQEAYSMVDLEYDNTYIDRIALTWGESFPQRFFIQTSVDGVEWNSAYYESDNHGGEKDYSINLTQARFVRVIEEGGNGTTFDVSISAFCDSNYAYTVKIPTSVVDHGGNKAVKNINDGNFKTRNEMGSRENNWVSYNFGRPIDISTVKVCFVNYNGNVPSAVTLLTSDEDVPLPMSTTDKTNVVSSWSKVETIATNAAYSAEADYSESGKMDGVTNIKANIAENVNIMISEFEIYTDTDFAAGAEVTHGTDVISRKEYSADQIFDRDKTTAWASEYSDDEYLIFDIGEEKPVYKLDLSFGGEFAKNFRILVSKDGADWSHAFTASDFKGGVKTVQFAARWARYIKVQFDARGTNMGYSLNEVKIYCDTAERAQRYEDSYLPLKLRLMEYYKSTNGDRYLDESFSYDDVYGFMDTMTEKGNWEDIDYASTVAASWPASGHYVRLANMATVYAAADTHALYHSEELKEKIIKGISWWFTNLPKSSNWWFNDMDPQMRFRSIGLYMREELSEQMLNTIINYEQNFVDNTHTGQNRTWFSQNVLMRGMISEDLTLVHNGMTGISDSIVVDGSIADPSKSALSEGIQADWSFTQHGVMLNNNIYGADYMASEGEWAELLQDTEFAFTDEQIEILTKLALNGNRWMSRYSEFDMGTKSRNWTCGEADDKAAMFLVSYQALRDINRSKGNNAEADALQALIDHINREDGTSNPGITGNRMFWRTDYMSQIRDKYMLSIRMISKGVKGSEETNGENKLGGLFAYGMTSISRDGREYHNIAPMLDWSLLSGVTAPRKELTPNQAAFMDETFVGGASNGIYGVAGMNMKKTISTVGTFAAKKSYFLFEDEMVCLGTGISGTSEQYPINTSINQTKLRGEVVADGNVLERTAGYDVTKETYQDDSTERTGRWVNHDGIGYVFTKDTAYRVKNGPQRGTHNRITDAAPLGDNDRTEDIFMMYLEHGKKPENASYEYIIVPDVTAEKTAAYSENIPVEILSNTEKLQAVKNESLGVYQYVFYERGRAPLGDCTLSVSEPCIVMAVDKHNGTYEVTVSNPETIGINIDVTLKNSAGRTDVSYAMSESEALLGKSVIKTVKIPDESSASIDTGEIHFINPETGNALNGIVNGGTVRVSVDAANEFSSPKHAVLYAALYYGDSLEEPEKNGTLVSVKQTEISLAMGECKTLSLDMEIPPQGSYRLKAMLWDGGDNMVPLTASVSLETAVNGLYTVSNLNGEKGAYRNTITWDPPYRVADSYHVYRDGQLLADVDGTEYTDMDIEPIPYRTDTNEPLKKYRYKVAAIVNGEESKESAEILVEAVEVALIEFNGVQKNTDGSNVMTVVDGEEYVTPLINEHGIRLIGCGAADDSKDAFINKYRGFGYEDVIDGKTTLRLSNEGTNTITGWNHHIALFDIDDMFMPANDRRFEIYITYYDNYKAGTCRFKLWYSSTASMNVKTDDHQPIGGNKWKIIDYAFDDGQFNNRMSGYKNADFAIERAGQTQYIHKIEIRNLDRETYVSTEGGELSAAKYIQFHPTEFFGADADRLEEIFVF